MSNIIGAIRNLFLFNRRERIEKDIQRNEGYSIEMEFEGAERSIIYNEKEHKVLVVAEFSLLNDVILHTDSLRKWNEPRDIPLTSFDYQRVLNRVTRYLSIWGEVSYCDEPLPTLADIKRSLSSQGISFAEKPKGVIAYEAGEKEVRNRFGK